MTQAVLGGKCLALRANTRSTGADEPCSEKTVQAAPFRAVELELVGEGPKQARGPDPVRFPGKLAGGDGIEPERLVAGEQGGDLGLAFFHL